MLLRRTCLAWTGALLVCVGADARAQTTAPVADGYCDHVKGVADADSALLMAPEVFTSFGYVDQLGVAASPRAGGDDLRLTLGVSYSLGSLYQAHLTRQRADAVCRRYRAVSAMSRGTSYRALEARARVLTGSMDEANRHLARAVAEFDQRRATLQELIATRLRVEELRALAADTQRALDALPAPGDDDMEGALTDYYAAESDLEEREAALRTARAWDVSVRAGYDQFLDNDDSTPFFAVVSARINLGRVLQIAANRRAADGRRRFAQVDGGVGGAEANDARLRRLLATERQRANDNGLLVADLGAQVKALQDMDTSAGRRLLQTVWFEWVQARAEQAYLEAHVASLEAVLGATE